MMRQPNPPTTKHLPRKGHCMLSKLSRTINEIRPAPLVLAVLVFSLLASACSSSHFPWLYRLDIEQGNVIDDEAKISQLKEGMTQRQVVFLLGTPVIRDTFHQERWDYLYSYRTGKGVLTRDRLNLTFAGDLLQSIERKKYDTVKIRE